MLIYEKNYQKEIQKDIWCSADKAKAKMAEIAIAGATAVLRQAAVVLGNLVVQEGSRLFRLTEDLEWIENEMGYVQAYLDDVEDKQWQSRGVTKLVRNIWDLSYDVQDIIATYFPKIAPRDSRYKRKGGVAWFKSAVCLPNHYKIVRDFAVEIEGIRRRIEDIDRVRRTYGIEEKSGRDEAEIWDPRRSFPHVDEDPVGLDEHVKQLVHKVLHDNDSSHPVLSIIGMAGLGKTTLAKKVYSAVARKFDCAAWICVSQRPNVPELLRDIAKQVGLEKEKFDENFEHNLFDFLGRKRYVLFIDDIWDAETWNYLKNGISRNSESKIVLTSRNKDIGIYVGGENSLHQLCPLEPENSKKLFLKIIRAPPQENMKETKNHLPPELETISEQILQRCGGVPLAIVLTASMLRLREKTEHSWKGVLESMGQEEDRCSKIFSLSYKDLPARLKPCFLYFGLFPEDYEIHVFDLINLWAAEGFIRGSEVRQVDEVGEDYLDQLIARNLIQVDQRRFNRRIKTCRIHDILHDLCVKVAKDINFFNTWNDAAVSDSGMKVRRVTTHDLFGSLNYKTPRLRSMLSFETGWELAVVPDKFFEDLRLVRVLRLSHPFGKIGHLSMLTYVQLELKNGSKLTSSISNLKSLQTLDLQGRYRITIPICIWKMKQFRHLLGSCKIEMDLRGWMLNKMGGKYFHHPIEAYSNTNLQSLYGLHFPESSPRHWFPKLTSLRKLGVSFWDGDLSNVKALLDSVTPASSKLEILRLENYGWIKYDIEELKLFSYKNLFRMHMEGNTVDLTDKILPPNLTKLTLRFTFLEKDPMETLKKLPNLKILKLLEFAYKGEKMEISAERGTETGGPPHNFPQLQVLTIEELDHLKELIVEEEMMPQLNKLIITRVHRDFVYRIPDKMEDIKPIIKGKRMDSTSQSSSVAGLGHEDSAQDQIIKVD